jgi:hypothetical protein
VGKEPEVVQGRGHLSTGIGDPRHTTPKDAALRCRRGEGDRADHRRGEGHRGRGHRDATPEGDGRGHAAARRPSALSAAMRTPWRHAPVEQTPAFRSALRLWLILAGVCTAICGVFAVGLILVLGDLFEFSRSLVVAVGVGMTFTWILGLAICAVVAAMDALAQSVDSDEARLLRRLRSAPRVSRRRRSGAA